MDATTANPNDATTAPGSASDATADSGRTVVGRSVGFVLLTVALVAVIGTGLVMSRSPADSGTTSTGSGTLADDGVGRIPAPSTDAAPGTATSAVAVLAGGCFWGVQGVFQQVEGVISAVSGYAGGVEQTAVYEQVVRGTTGHAESVAITYDPQQISYGQLLQIYFSVVHDPTQLNRQGPDVGPHYRSAIFPTTQEQVSVAQAYINQLDQAQLFDTEIVTTIELDKTFYPAEDHHQDFVTRNPTHPYVVAHDLPKIRDLETVFPDIYRPDPVLVLAS